MVKKKWLTSGLATMVVGSLMLPMTISVWAKGTELQQSSIEVVDANTRAIVESGSCGDNLNWTLDTDGYLIITGAGTEIEQYAFSGVEDIQYVELPEHLKKIGRGAFYHSQIQEINIPDSVEIIDNWAFGDCENLTVVNFSSAEVRLGNSTFWGTPWLNELKDNCKEDYLVVNGNVLAYNGCTSNLVLPDTIKYIPDGGISDGELETFRLDWWRGVPMDTLLLPEGLEYIGDYAFYQALEFVHSTNYEHSLKEVVIPASVKYIGDMAFGEHYDLQTVTFRGDAPTFYQYDYFDDDDYAYEAEEEYEYEKDIATRYIFGGHEWVSEFECHREPGSTPLTIRYPAGNKTWDSVKEMDFGRDVIWEEYVVHTEHSFVEELHEESCENPGYILHRCEECEYYYVTDYTSSWGHVNTTKIVKKATPTKNGTKRETCERCGKVKDITINKVSEICLKKTSYTYDGKTHKPGVWVEDCNYEIIPKNFYTIEYSSSSPKNVGTYEVTITLNSEEYKGSKVLTYKINKAKQPMVVTAAKTSVKYSASKNQTIALKVTKNQGKVTYSSSNTKYVTVSSKGVITVKKKAKKGKYTITVKAAGNANYKSGSKKVEITVK